MLALLAFGVLCVQGLPVDIKERELDDLYYRYGRIDYIELRRPRDGRLCEARLRPGAVRGGRGHRALRARRRGRRVSWSNNVHRSGSLQAVEPPNEPCIHVRTRLQDTRPAGLDVLKASMQCYMHGLYARPIAYTT